MSASSSSRSSNSGWSRKENKRFERALALYDDGTEDRWQKVADFIGGGTSPTEAKRHYERLLDDVQSIESGDVPMPNYRSSDN
ncbi:Protein RADIALIS-like 1 [Platanthera zijinensis]|uniref:Protein RADIALIS-like 1 n=1 Tax=Platanthera zijinensis TaxID=2320716 RepID=A0AAP0BE54_9ASPA